MVVFCVVMKKNMIKSKIIKWKITDYQIDLKLRIFMTFILPLLWFYVSNLSLNPIYLLLCGIKQGWFLGLPVTSESRYTSEKIKPNNKFFYEDRHENMGEKINKNKDNMLVKNMPSTHFLEIDNIFEKRINIFKHISVPELVTF